MSTDFSIRPVGTPAPSPVVQPPGQAANQAVSTELPAGQSVTAAEAGGSARNDPQSVSDDVSRQAFFDRAAGSMVYQVVNSQTDEVVEQYPDDAALRRRTYFRALDQAKSDPEHVIPTDLTA